MTWWMLIGVETEMPWPVEDYHVEFKGRQILLRPPTDRRMPMVCIEGGDLPMNDDSLAILAREFMSELVWVSPYPLVEITRSSASFLMDIGPPPLRHCKGLGFYIDYLPQLQEAKPKLALAFYREAKSVNSLPYRFLGYWKVISLLHGDGSANQRQWLIDCLGVIEEYDAKKRLMDLRAAGETDDDIVRKRLYVSRRCAVAHATSQPVINPDDPSHEYEIWLDLPLIKAIAEYAIEFEFGVKSAQTVWREHLYELDGFKKFFSTETISALKAGNTALVTTNDLIPALDVRIATKPQLGGFTNLNVRIRQVKDGKVLADCSSPDDLMQIPFLLDFSEERLEFNPVGTIVITDDGSARAIQLAIDYFRFSYDLFSNGRIQFFEHGSNNLLGKKDPFLATNINLGATLKSWEREITRLEQELRHRQSELWIVSGMEEGSEEGATYHKSIKSEAGEGLSSVSVPDASVDVPET